MHRYIITRPEAGDAIRGILRAMLESDKSDTYKGGAIDFAASLSDVFGIGVIDGKGDLHQIGNYSSNNSSDIRPGSVHRQQLGDHATMRDAGSG